MGSLDAVLVLRFVTGVKERKLSTGSGGPSSALHYSVHYTAVAGSVQLIMIIL